MADIELVIKIPEEIRVAITSMGLLRMPDEMQKKVDRAIQRGTPLPKGHWINKQRLFYSCSAECSSCHKRSNGYMHDNGFSLECKYYDFCPNCGSENREVEE